MNCRTFQRRWQSLLDERLSPQDDPELIEHAWECERCQQLLNGQQQLWNLLASEPTPAPSSNFANSIVAHVNQPTLGVPRTSRGFAIWTWVAIAASLLLVIAPVALHFRGQQPVGPDSFVKQGKAESPDQLADGNSADSKAGIQEIERMVGLISRIGEEEIDQSVGEITGRLRPITASFGVTFGALRRTFPLPNKSNVQKPQAGSSNLDVFA